MPTINEIRTSKELGYKCGNKFIWLACLGCGEPKWVSLSDVRRRRSLRCHRCASLGNRWSSKSGKASDSRGYIRVRIYPDDFFYPMATKAGYVLQHRLVVAKAIGRCLHSWEIVHHLHARYPGGSVEDKQDNRYPENLQLVQEMQHKQITILENKLDKLLTGQHDLMKEIRLLRFENKQLREKLCQTKV